MYYLMISLLVNLFGQDKGILKNNAIFFINSIYVMQVGMPENEPCYICMQAGSPRNKNVELLMLFY